MTAKLTRAECIRGAMRPLLVLEEDARRMLFNIKASGVNPNLAMLTFHEPDSSGDPDLDDVETFLLTRDEVETLYFKVGEALGKTAGMMAINDLKDAANMLDINEFCSAVHWPSGDEYARDKFAKFQEIGRFIAYFDTGVIRNAVAAYREIRARRGAERRRAHS